MQLASRIHSVASIDHLQCGNAARAQRTLANLTLREVGRRMGVSAAYLSDLELGRRNWSVELVQRFNDATRISADRRKPAKRRA